MNLKGNRDQPLLQKVRKQEVRICILQDLIPGQYKMIHQAKVGIKSCSFY